jgi:hypothetical protein
LLLLRPGIEELNNLLLISFRRVPERHQSILWIVSLLLGFLQREAAGLAAVISLFQSSRIKEFCRAMAVPSLYFRCNNSENSGARGSRVRPKGRPGMTLRVN